LSKKGQEKLEKEEESNKEETSKDHRSGEKYANL